MRCNNIKLLLLISITLSGLTVQGDDWPQWGRDATRNMISSEKAISHDFNVGKFKDQSNDVDLSTTKNVKWVAPLGSEAYGNVTVAQGKVFVGTNNDTPRDPKHVGDRGVLLCLDEKTGELLWQLVVPKLKSDDDLDMDYLGICSSPTVDGDKVYVVTNRCEVVCLDINGQKNGNDGPFKDEGVYMADQGQPPLTIGQTDADILWRYDMRAELQVYPHNITSSAVLVFDDRIYATTSNGKDGMHKTIPSPHAPCLIVLDKNTGKLLGVESSGISQRMMHCNWSSPAFAVIDVTPMIVFGAGDGFCYGFDPIPVKSANNHYVLKERWRFDCVPEEYKAKDYNSPDGPSEIISTPVVANNYVYAAIGQDPEKGDGVGRLSCIDLSKTGDISKTGVVWSYKEITRSLSTPSITDGLLFMADYAGFVHCLNAKTGDVHWVHDTASHIWGSTIVVDGKVYVGNEDGYLTVLKADKEKSVINEIDMGAPVYSSPVVANGVLYISTQTHLYAIQ